MNDARIAEILLSAIRVCRNCEPKFGAGGAGQTLEQFQRLYGGAPFIVAAHESRRFRQ